MGTTVHRHAERAGARTCPGSGTGTQGGMRGGKQARDRQDPEQRPCGQEFGCSKDDALMEGRDSDLIRLDLGTRIERFLDHPKNSRVTARCDQTVTGSVGFASRGAGLSTQPSARLVPHPCVGAP